MDSFEHWKPILKPGELTESRLINAFLDNTFPINSNLPGERELASLLGVTRPTLREALQRLERDGWVEIRHGKSTRVRDFWVKGNLGVTIAIAQHQHPLPSNFISDLMSVRVLLAPTYTTIAMRNAPKEIAQFLSSAVDLEDKAEAFTFYDWELHWQLTLFAQNSFFTHFMNSVRRLYEIVGIPYFSHTKTRLHSRKFYASLYKLAIEENSEETGKLTLKVMSESAALWDEIMSRESSI
ncbi:MAG: fatty acid metabolism transcriptional regulator FadR [Pelolinea sp.]|nr:fatty acid metabolism transcriptional regulator FadR [Pelolinea sp.]